ncbi:hypothetical protein ACERZ8_00195 [Tateyamaria armeniaca]|uniref:Uncharacterized protein n=1 Tax=Tateyamaria armeniaca TaxID=2518930 RepID=A0ABW8UT50_9RHOB
MMRGTKTRQLQGMRVGLSISNSEDAEAHGFDDAEVNRATREIAQAVLAQGGSLVFGHDWRPEGVMASLFRFAMDYQMPRKDLSEAEVKEAAIRNYVAWPRTTNLSRAERRRFEDVLDIKEIRPPDIPRTATHTPLRNVESLTYMRAALVEDSDARVALGGRTSGSGGRCSGVVEECLLTLQADKPLYLSGIFGGATQQVIEVIRGQDSGDLSAFRPRADVAEALGEVNLADGFGISPNAFFDYPVWQLAQRNGLTVEQNEQMFDAVHLNDVIGLMLIGMGQLSDDRYRV